MSTSLSGRSSPRATDPNIAAHWFGIWSDLVKQVGLSSDKHSALTFDLLARSACQKGRASESPRGGCLVDCCEQAGVQREICLRRPARIEDERYDCERGALGERSRHFG